MCWAEPAKRVLVPGPVQPIMLVAPARSPAHDPCCFVVPAHMESWHAGRQSGQPYVFLQYISLVGLWGHR